MTYPAWYFTLEPEVRQIVYGLRNAGINTTGSCGHEMWVYCDSVEGVQAVEAAGKVLQELGYQQYDIEFRGQVRVGNDYARQSLRLTWISKTAKPFLPESLGGEGVPEDEH